MTPDVMTVTPQTRTRACMTLMSQRKFRHLPVVDGDKVVGMISIQDLMDDIICGPRGHHRAADHLHPELTRLAALRTLPGHG